VLDGSVAAKLDLMKGKLDQMEQAVRNQVAEVRSELASVQTKMQADMKDQLVDFLAAFIKLNSQTPPPHTKPVDSVASNVAQHMDLQSYLGEKTPPSHPYSYSASPQSLHTSKPNTTQTN
jgi:hypothetical protein